ncbi:hypothetical protein OG887_42800 (plasmid) [Streptomyces sp. NBC_00053]|nr:MULTISPECIES: hypothetical protein [unclassified Streptomyces]MCX5505940.1 hypothetical protein [Streptomyces sp. NBC_00052]MCX5553595.1 hypothetical protein [Streptomyces sp. NBC_00051]
MVCPGGATGAAQELVEGVGEVGFVLVAVTALFDLGLWCQRASLKGW